MPAPRGQRQRCQIQEVIPVKSLDKTIGTPPYHDHRAPPSYTCCASPPASRPRTPPSAAPPIAVGMSCRSGSSCRPRAAHADASRPPMRARRHRLGPDPRQPNPSPEPTGPRPRASRVPPTRGAVCAHPRPATRRASPCRAGSAAVPVIPAKWCGDTIAHTRKLRF